MTDFQFVVFVLENKEKKRSKKWKDFVHSGEKTPPKEDLKRKLILKGENKIG